MTRRTLILVTAVSVAWTIVLWLFHDPGTFNIDEVHYLLAAKSFAETAGFVVPNGFDRFPHNLLLFMHPARLAELPGQTGMTAFIPPWYCIFAAPFHRLFGLPGLFLLTALCYAASLVLVAVLASRAAAAPDRAAWLALAAAVGGTYWADYGVAVINHALDAALALGAIALHPAFARRDDRAEPLLARAFACGMLAGIATGVRYQTVVTAFGLGVFMLAAHPAAIRRAFAFLAGFLPWIVALSMVNAARFGDPFPFSYGVTANWKTASLLGVFVRHFLPFVLLLALAAGIVAFLYGRLLARWSALPPDRRSTIVFRAIAALCALPVLLLALPPFRAHVLERFLGVWLWPAGESWHVAGPLSLFAGVRRAWLQSFPLAPLCLAAPVVAAWRARRASGVPDAVLLAGALLWLHTLFALLLHNNGGYFFNQRYLLDATLFGVIALSTVAAPALDRTSGPAIGGGGVVAVLLALFYLLAVQKGGPATPFEVLVDRGILPLVALLLVIAVALSYRVPRLRILASILLPVALVLPLVVHAWTDMAASHEYRKTRREAYERLLAVVPDGSLLVVYGGQREPAGRLKESRDVWVADAQRTEWEGVSELVAFVRESGARERVFLSPAGDVPPALLRETLTLGTLVFEKPFPLYELPRAAPGSARP